MDNTSGINLDEKSSSTPEKDTAKFEHNISTIENLTVSKMGCNSSLYQSDLKGETREDNLSHIKPSDALSSKQENIKEEEVDLAQVKSHLRKTGFYNYDVELKSIAHDTVDNLFKSCVPKEQAIKDQNSLEIKASSCDKLMTSDVISKSDVSPNSGNLSKVSSLIETYESTKKKLNNASSIKTNQYDISQENKPNPEEKLDKDSTEINYERLSQQPNPRDVSNIVNFTNERQNICTDHDITSDSQIEFENYERLTQQSNCTDVSNVVNFTNERQNICTDHNITSDSQIEFENFERLTQQPNSTDVSNVVNFTTDRQNITSDSQFEFENYERLTQQSNPTDVSNVVNFTNERQTICTDHDTALGSQIDIENPREDDTNLLHDKSDITIVDVTNDYQKYCTDHDITSDSQIEFENPREDDTELMHNKSNIAIVDLTNESQKDCTDHDIALDSQVKFETSKEDDTESLHDKSNIKKLIAAIESTTVEPNNTAKIGVTKKSQKDCIDHDIDLDSQITFENPREDNTQSMYGKFNITIAHVTNESQKECTDHDIISDSPIKFETYKEDDTKLLHDKSNIKNGDVTNESQKDSTDHDIASDSQFRFENLKEDDTESLRDKYNIKKLIAALESTTVKLNNAPKAPFRKPSYTSILQVQKEAISNTDKLLAAEYNNQDNVENKPVPEVENSCVCSSDQVGQNFIIDPSMCDTHYKSQQFTDNICFLCTASANVFKNASKESDLVNSTFIDNTDTMQPRCIEYFSLSNEAVSRENKESVHFSPTVVLDYKVKEETQTKMGNYSKGLSNSKIQASNFNDLYASNLFTSTVSDSTSTTTLVNESIKNAVSKQNDNVEIKHADTLSFKNIPPSENMIVKSNDEIISPLEICGKILQSHLKTSFEKADNSSGLLKENPQFVTSITCYTQSSSCCNPQSLFGATCHELQMCGDQDPIANAKDLKVSFLNPEQDLREALDDKISATKSKTISQSSSKLSGFHDIDDKSITDSLRSQLHMNGSLKSKGSKDSETPDKNLSEEDDRMLFYLQKLFDDLQKEKHRIEVVIDQLQQKHNQIKENEQQAVADIVARTETVKQWLLQSKEEAIDSAQSLALKGTNEIQDEIQHLQNLYSIINDHCSHVTSDKLNQCSDQYSLNMIKSELVSTLNLILGDRKGYIKLVGMPDLVSQHNSSAVRPAQIREFIGYSQLSGPLDKEKEEQVSIISDNCPYKFSSFPKKLIYSDDVSSYIYNLLPVQGGLLWIIFKRGDSTDNKTNMKLIDYQGNASLELCDSHICKQSAMRVFGNTAVFRYSLVNGKEGIIWINSDGEVEMNKKKTLLDMMSSSASGHCYVSQSAGEYDRVTIRSLYPWKVTRKPIVYNLGALHSLSKLCDVSLEERYLAILCMGNVHVLQKNESDTYVQTGFYFMYDVQTVTDLRFCCIDGIEVLLAVVPYDSKVHILDHTNNCKFLGYLDTSNVKLNNPCILETDYLRHVWIGCDGGEILMVDV